MGGIPEHNEDQRAERGETDDSELGQELKRIVMRRLGFRHVAFER